MKTLSNFSSGFRTVFFLELVFLFNWKVVLFWLFSGLAFATNGDVNHLVKRHVLLDKNRRETEKAIRTAHPLTCDLPAMLK
jgi:hypothetical protein